MNRNVYNQEIKKYSKRNDQYTVQQTRGNCLLKSFFITVNYTYMYNLDQDNEESKSYMVCECSFQWQLLIGTNQNFEHI